MVYVIITLAFILIIFAYFFKKRLKSNAQISDVKDSKINISSEADVIISDVKNSTINIK